MKSMQVLIDTNVLLDWLMAREPYQKSAKKVLSSCIMGQVQGYVAAHTLTDIFYISRKQYDNNMRKRVLLFLCENLTIISENVETFKAVLENASWPDLEDGLQMQCAEDAKLDYVITRNIKDFQTSKVPAIEPDTFLEKL